MEITIKGNPKEIADLVLAVQSRQTIQPSPIKTLQPSPIKTLEETMRSAICDIDEE